jgi:hypothetical protein
VNYLPPKDTLEYWAAAATILGVFFAIGATVYAARQFWLARKAGSVTFLIALSECFRQCWLAFIGAIDERSRNHAFADLTNALEIACAGFNDKVFFGASKDVVERYLIDVFKLIEESTDAQKRLLGLLQTATTFENIRLFLERHRKAIHKINSASEPST